ncbi:ABC transporter substrate-binding protein (plasmid) [Halorussus limi]|uniref:ABC transporter substrate-binding protein n=1 Tax=Halorussus limi TaxID=2938695 RepID=A0A8U0I0B8_9EURY|nr:ABC transporter substrate-binding protein [Halorussus limi]UPV76815.1 ABC transporter substrate-binding protein [Halorussus limi]
MVNDNHVTGGDTDGNRVTRRQWLALGGGAALTGLAGCSGDNPNETDVTMSSKPDETDTTGETDTEQSGGSPVTTTLNMRAPVSWQPSKSNVNPFTDTKNTEYWMDYMWSESPVYPNARGEPIYWLADEINLKGGGCEVHIKLSEDYTWWDGTPVTAKDVHTTQLISDYKNYMGPDQTEDSWEVVDKYTVKNVLPGPANPSLKKSQYYSVVAKHDYFKSWLEKYEDASNESAVKQVTKNLQEHRITLNDLTEKGLGCGLWKPTQLSPTKAVHEKYQDHPRADWTNLETFNWHLISEKQKAIQALKTGKLDMGDKTVTQAQSNDRVSIFNRFGTSSIVKLAMNWNNEHLARRPVRRAIAYLLDHDELVKIIKTTQGLKYKSRSTVNGLSSKQAQKWGGKSFQNKLIGYGRKSQPEKAKKVLQDAGYSKKGGVWVGPNGSKVNDLTYLTPPWNIYETIGNYLSPKLDKFGFKNKLIIPSSSGFWKRWTDTHDFDMVNWFSNTSHPGNAFATNSVAGLGKYNEVATVKQPKGKCKVNRTTPELSQPRSKKLNHPIRPKFPKKVGTMGTGGEQQTLYPVKWNDIITQTQSADEVKKYAKKFMWYMNWQVPHIGFYDETRAYWGNTDKFNFPTGKVDDHPNAKETKSEHFTNAMEFLSKGHISAKTK